MPRIQIDDGAIITTKAVVTKNVAHYIIVGGNPRIPIKKRFYEDIITELL